MDGGRILATEVGSGHEGGDFGLIQNWRYGYEVMSRMIVNLDDGRALLRV